MLLKPGYDVLIDDLAHMHGKTQHGPRKLSINNMLEAEKLLVNSRHSLCLDPSPRVSTVLGAMHYNAHKYDDCPPKRRPESPRIVVQCAPWASNGPNHLGLSAELRALHTPLAATVWIDRPPLPTQLFEMRTVRYRARHQVWLDVLQHHPVRAV